MAARAMAARVMAARVERRRVCRRVVLRWLATQADVDGGGGGLAGAELHLEHAALGGGELVRVRREDVVQQAAHLVVRVDDARREPVERLLCRLEGDGGLADLERGRVRGRRGGGGARRADELARGGSARLVAPTRDGLSRDDGGAGSTRRGSRHACCEGGQPFERAVREAIESEAAVEVGRVLVAVAARAALTPRRPHRQRTLGRRRRPASHLARLGQATAKARRPFGRDCALRQQAPKEGGAVRRARLGAVGRGPLPLGDTHRARAGIPYSVHVYERACGHHRAAGDVHWHLVVDNPISGHRGPQLVGWGASKDDELRADAIEGVVEDPVLRLRMPDGRRLPKPCALLVGELELNLRRQRAYARHRQADASDARLAELVLEVVAATLELGGALRRVAHQLRPPADRQARPAVLRLRRRVLVAVVRRRVGVARCGICDML
mmetsp:Transcript_60847/g.166790  ORF Transcript_60847/g.166790 Transcript_60847/m.166790 type:complete len:441 (-) Transcript_60847:292-1614(-)